MASRCCVTMQRTILNPILWADFTSRKRLPKTRFMLAWLGTISQASCQWSIELENQQSDSSTNMCAQAICENADTFSLILDWANWRAAATLRQDLFTFPQVWGNCFLNHVQSGSGIHPETSSRECISRPRERS